MSVILALVLAAPLTAPPDPLLVAARRGFRAIEREEATVAIQGSGDPLARADLLAGRYREAALIVEDRLGLRADVRPVLFECSSASSFRETVAAIAGEPPPRFAVAVAIPAVATIVVDRTSFQPIVGPQPISTLAHEIAHLLLHRRTSRIARWLDEGIALWASGEHVDPHGLQTLRYWASRRNVIPFADITADFPRDHSLTAFAYVESLRVVTYLIERRGGLPPLFQLLAAAAGGDLRAAWRAVYREEPETTWEAWRAFEASLFDPLLFLVNELPAFTIPAILVIAGYVRYRITRRRSLAEEEEEGEEVEEGEAWAPGAFGPPAPGGQEMPDRRTVPGGE